MADVIEKYRIVGENAVGAAFNQVLRQSKSTADTMASHFRKAFGAVSAVAIGRTLQDWTKQAIENAESIGNLAEAFGTTVDELSRFDYAARQNNATLEQLAPGLTAFSKNLVLAGEDSGRAQKALAALNLDAAKLARIPLPRQLEEVADAFSKVENPTDRVRISAQLFGDEVGRRMIPILARGRDGLRAFAEESDRTGATLTKEMAASLRATDAEFDRLQARSMLLKRELAIGLGPVLVETGGFFNTAALGALRFGAAMAKAIHGAAEPVDRFQDSLTELAERRGLLLRSIEQASAHGASAELIAKFRAEIGGVEAEMNRVNKALQQLGRDAQAYEPFKPIEDGAARASDEIAKLQAVMISGQRITSGFSAPLEQMFRNTATDAEKAAESYRQFRAELEILRDAGRITASQFDARMQEFFDKNLSPFEVTGKKVLTEANSQAEKLMATLKDEAARRALDAMSEVIYNMGSGMDDFAKSAIDAFRQILADEAARKLFALFKGVGSGDGGSGGLWGAIASGIGALFGSIGDSSNSGGGFRGLAARGMTLNPGEWAIAGDAGPEPVFGGTHGATIIPFPKGGRAGGGQVINVTVAPVNNIDARGASVELVARLPAILRESNRQAVEEAEVRIVTGLQRNKYDLRQ